MCMVIMYMYGYNVQCIYSSIVIDKLRAQNLAILYALLIKIER